MSRRRLSFVVIILVTLPRSQPQLTINSVKNKAFDEFCVIGSFDTERGEVAECLEYCLQDCRCQSFQICQNTKCQLCSSHRKENRSLLHEDEECIYAMYEMRDLHEKEKIFKDQCSSMGCSMNAKCCLQSGVCPNNKICKPFTSRAKPWKRFTCVCQDGYHGDDCTESITSCQGYAQGSRKSGLYKIVDPNGVLYQVYCHFDSDGAWTLVQSFSFAQRTVGGSQFATSLTTNTPVGEDAQPDWNAYRLGKARMQRVIANSDHVRLTCDFGNVDNVNQTDYIQVPLGQPGLPGDFTATSPNTNVLLYRGKINEIDLKGCEIKLHDGDGFHVHIKETAACSFVPAGKPGGCNKFNYFGKFGKAECIVPTHRCAQDLGSTTQLWFGNSVGQGT